MLRTFCALVLLLPLAACDMLTSGSSASARIQTDAEAYVATIDAYTVSFSVPFSYANRSGRKVYLHGCRVPNPPSVEKKIEGDWMTVYSPVVLACLGPPTPVGPGQTYRGELAVTAGLPGSNLHPKWEAAEVPGTYRLRWRVEERGGEREVLSNAFTLVVQDTR